MGQSREKIREYRRKKYATDPNFRKKEGKNTWRYIKKRILTDSGFKELRTNYNRIWMQVYRNHPEYKLMDKTQKNLFILDKLLKDKYFKKTTAIKYQKGKKRLASKKVVENLADVYIKYLIKKAIHNIENITPELIDIYRYSIKLKRLIRKYRNYNHNEQLYYKATKSNRKCRAAEYLLKRRESKN